MPLPTQLNAPQLILNQMAKAGKPRTTTTTTTPPKEPFDWSKLALTVAMLMGDVLKKTGTPTDAMNAEANSMNDAFAASPAGNPLMAMGPQGVADPMQTIPFAGPKSAVGSLTPEQLMDLWNTVK